MVDEQPEGDDIDPHLRYSQPVNVLTNLNYMLLPRLAFSHKYALAVLMANACGGSALCGMKAGGLLFVPIAVRYY